MAVFILLYYVQRQRRDSQKNRQYYRQLHQQFIHAARLVLTEEGFCAAGDCAGQPGTLALLEKHQRDNRDTQNDLKNADYKI
jgi:hypothetical protein